MLAELVIHDATHGIKVEAVMINGRIYLPSSYTKSIPYVVLEITHHNGYLYFNNTIPMTQIAGVETIECVEKAFDTLEKLKHTWGYLK